MDHSCNKKNCPYRKSNKRRTMRGGGCPCNKSSGLFSGGRRTNRRKTNRRRRTIRGGSAGLSSLSSSAYYPQNDYMNDMSDPSKQIAGRFTGVPTVSPNYSGGRGRGRCKTYRYPSKKGKKMQGGSGMFASHNFLGTFGNASGINNTSSTWLGANTVNPPSYLQNAASVYTDNTNSGYNAQNPYLV